MHIAELTLNQTDTRGAPSLQLTINAVYRLKNVSDNDRTQGLLLQPTILPLNLTANTLPFDAISLVANGQPLPIGDLQKNNAERQDGNVGYSTEIFIPASKQVTLNLRYSMPLAAEQLNGIYYDLAPLAAWPGSFSLRINFTLNDLIHTDSWLEIGPTNWKFAPSAISNQADIRWLYDLQLPGEPLRLQFIHPTYWRTIQEAEAATQPDNALSYNFSRLGKLYQDLYQTSQLQSTSVVRDRFYAQTLAAYMAGLAATERNSAPLSDIAKLHVGLAKLYRTRIVENNDKKNQYYLRLMITEARKSTATLPKDDPNIPELYLWQVEGLNTLLEDLVQKEQWPQALSLLDELDALPDSIVDHRIIADQRRDFKLQQALNLLEAEKQNAAYVLAQTQLDSQELFPPLTSQSLFTRWQVSITVKPTGTDMGMTTFPVPNRTDEAWSALQTILDNWREQEQAEANGYLFDLYEFNLSESGQSDSRAGNIAWHLELFMPAPMTGISLTKTLPPEPDWALVHALLSQIGPRYEEQTERLWRKDTLRQPIDLRFVDEQWTVMARTLEEQANQFTAIAHQSAASPEQVLRSRIQATNYYEASQVWHSLAQNSWAMITLSLSPEPSGDQNRVLRLGNAPPEERTWLVAPQDATQLFEIQSQGVGIGRLMGLSVLLLFGLFLLAGILWWLL